LAAQFHLSGRWRCPSLAGQPRCLTRNKIDQPGFMNKL
jgi:hypothetical protein